MTNDAPLTDAEIAALARAGYTPNGSGIYSGVAIEKYLHMGKRQAFAHTSAEWRAIIADLPDYWSEASRDEARAKVATLREAELRKPLDAVLDTDDPALLVACLRGSAFGLAARVKREETSK